jgi:hypothetical protein
MHVRIQSKHGTVDWSGMILINSFQLMKKSNGIKKIGLHVIDLMLQNLMHYS